MVSARIAHAFGPSDRDHCDCWALRLGLLCGTPDQPRQSTHATGLLCGGSFDRDEFFLVDGGRSRLGDDLAHRIGRFLLEFDAGAVVVGRRYGKHHIGTESLASTGHLAQPRVASSNPLDWVEKVYLPNISLVRFERSDASGSLRHLFGPQGEGHAVVILGRDEQGNWIVADPAFGKTRWSEQTFRERFTRGRTVAGQQYNAAQKSCAERIRPFLLRRLHQSAVLHDLVCRSPVSDIEGTELSVLRTRFVETHFVNDVF